jgi:multicomponent Na+:H+ antiporter subunit G
MIDGGAWTIWSGWLGLAMMFGGLFFTLTAALGFVRLPDVYCRLHITGVLDTMGVPLILLGAAVYIGPSLTAAKLLLCVVFLYGTSPLVGHLLARAALDSGQVPSPETRGISHKPRPGKKARPAYGTRRTHETPGEEPA